MTMKSIVQILGSAEEREAREIMAAEEREAREIMAAEEREARAAAVNPSVGGCV